jgi:hypothetical protein
VLLAVFQLVGQLLPGGGGVRVAGRGFGNERDETDQVLQYGSVRLRI